MAGVEISAPAEKTSGSGKSWQPAYCLGSAESPTADFLLDWLKSSHSDPRRYVASLSCRPQVRPQPRLPCFYEESLPYCTGCLYRPDMPKYTRKPKLLAALHIFTNSCENSKILSRLLSVLSLRQKFVCDHYCCPISAIILTASKLEAILDFWQGYRKTVPMRWGGGCEGGRKWRKQASCFPYRIWGGGGGREGGGGKN